MYFLFPKDERNKTKEKKKKKPKEKMKSIDSTSSAVADR